MTLFVPSQVFAPALEILSSPNEVGRSAAEKVVAVVKAKPNAVIALPTGRTALPMYHHLIKVHKARQVDFSKVTFINLDEYYGVSFWNPRSYHFYMWMNFFLPIRARPDQVHILNGKTKNIVKTCQDLETFLQAKGGIDLLVAGTGRNGHLAFCEVIADFTRRTHLALLADTTREDNAPLWGGKKKNVPTHALTLGIDTMVQAKEVIVLAAGTSKANAILIFINCAREGKMITTLALSALLENPRVTFYLDTLAASAIPQKWLGLKEPVRPGQYHATPDMSYIAS